MAIEKNATTKTIWNFFRSKGLTAAGTAGLMGNLYAESGCNPINLQNTFEKKLGYNDVSYTKSVDSGKYKNFVHDSAGYGLAQWTFHTRKAALYEYCKRMGTSIGDLQSQLEYLWQELSKIYTKVLHTLKTTTNVTTASNEVLTRFERPANQGASVKQLRASYGMKYYKLFASEEHVDKFPMAKVQKGDSGQQIRALQKILGGLTVDGIYGEKTKSAVEAYQRYHKLTATGVCDSKTWAKILGG